MTLVGKQLAIVLVVAASSCGLGATDDVPSSARQDSGRSGGGIRPYCQNPSYWQYLRKPMLLFGGSDRDNIFQWAGDGTRLTDHLDLLAKCGGNYIRCTMSSREYTPQGYRWDRLPYPFAKIGDEYDLRQWNDVYWRKLRTFLTETRKRDIIVQLEFWDRWNESGDSRSSRFGWYDSPWNPNKIREQGVRPINHVKCYHFNWPIGSNLNRGRTASSDAEAGAKFWRAVFAGAASIRCDQSVRIRLIRTERQLELRWLDVATSRWKHQVTHGQNGERKLKAPNAGHWVAVLAAPGP